MDKTEMTLLGAFLLLIFLAFLVVSVAVVESNNSDNELYKQAIERGCSVINEEILCPGVAR